ncbi:MAG: SRPBCC family protein [Sphingobacteriales bacterium JAD_PAG50586_3]|nr:MAG: SRPBCC family protein [Sphingobacteriales bacterium JAD_PAG50586_3]
MSHTEYHGQTAEVNAPAGQVFNYLADMRNFGELMPKSVSDWQADKDSCSFTIRSLGELKIRYEKKKFLMCWCALPNTAAAITD